MKIQFHEIPAEGFFLEIKDQAWFPDKDISRTERAKASVFLQRKGKERVLLTGDLSVRVSFDCDRCLETYQKQLAGEFRIDIELVEGGIVEQTEHRCTEEEMDVLYIFKPEIDLLQVLRQQVFLLLPEKKICLEGCRGLCPYCGVNLNEESCSCQEEKQNNPFSVLAGMKR